MFKGEVGRDAWVIYVNILVEILSGRSTGRTINDEVSDPVLFLCCDSCIHFNLDLSILPLYADLLRRSYNLVGESHWLAVSVSVWNFEHWVGVLALCILCLVYVL